MKESLLTDEQFDRIVIITILSAITVIGLPVALICIAIMALDLIW